ncbi:MAG: hypothetical protein HYY23_02560 [Verrucomicrobia bacterium]|nr:hypothetical protein [Verrucomicrobiota bacterium]
MTSFRTRFFKPLLGLLAAVLLLANSFIQEELNENRETMGLTRADLLENAPPVLAFTTVALGGFRGLIANMLWIRVADLQEQDKFFEMVQLSDWITKLQPHFATVWVHLAWNMSYNISVKFNDPKDRWLWVKRGIELLRDEGLRYNPKEALLYRELAWHFQHKMGANLDDAHNYYKGVWVEEMNRLLGSGRPNYDELLNPQTDEAKARVQSLRERYKMDPRWMKEVDDRYGPLEWRLPETHAIYWAVVGTENVKDGILKDQDLINLRRVIFQSMQLAFHRGRLVFFTKGSSEFTTAPNLEIVARANRTYEEMIELEPNMRQNIETAHKNFLKTAVYFLYDYNRLTQAEEWFKYLRQKYPAAIPASQNLDDYALARVAEDINETSHDRVKGILEGMLESVFLNLAIDEDDLAVGYDRFAQRIWNRFMQEIGTISKERVGLPPLAQLKKQVLDRMLDPESGLEPQIANQLRTKLGLPAAAPSATSTNRPPITPPSTNAPATNTASKK